ncbi:ATP-binding protein [Thiolapillus sp.]
MRSIRKQVLMWVMGFLALTLLIMLSISYLKALHEIEEIFDAELAQTARLIGQLVMADAQGNGLSSTVSVPLDESNKYRYEKFISYQVWHGDELLLKSSYAPEEALSTVAGFRDVSYGDQRWRVFGLHIADSEYRVYTSEDTVAREELSWYFAVQSLGVMFWAFPLFALIVAVTVERGLRPLRRLSAEVGSRDIHQLAPVTGDHIPEELVPLVDALNALLARLDAAISRERRFAADASHELRTPLSAIRLHSQLALRAGSMEESRQFLEKLIHGVDQSTYMVEQLLALARLSPENGTVALEKTDLVDLCQTLIEQLSEAAAEKGIGVAREYAASELARVNSNHHLLRTILRNLLDNAIRYSPPGSQIQCNIIQDGGETIISIQDNGPGIPDDQLQQVTERFVRLAGQDIQGCGLGLSIVSQAAKCIGARLILKNRADGQSGLIASVVLPG